MDTCNFPECERQEKVRGLCKAHYEQRRKGCALSTLGFRAGRGGGGLPVDVRLWAKVDKSGECWEWKGAKDPQGYGFIKDGRRRLLTHRVAWMSTRGAVPSELMLDHMCRNPGCVNPDHLQPVTNKLNQENRRSAQANNTAGSRGVHKNGARWRARAKHNGVDYSAGTYSTIAEAEAAAMVLRNQLFTNNLLDRTTP